MQNHTVRILGVIDPIVIRQLFARSRWSCTGQETPSADWFYFGFLDKQEHNFMPPIYPPLLCDLLRYLELLVKGNRSAATVLFPD